jgi:endonuclease G
MSGKPYFQRACAWSLLVLTAVLAACSGGGSGGSSPVAVSSGPAGSPVFSVKFVPLTPKVRPQQFTSAHFCPPFMEFGSPSVSVDFLCRTGFAVGHNPEARTPAWVMERLGISSINGGIERTDNFRADPDLLLGRRAELEDYVGSGFDRGHMAPAGDLTWSLQAMTESFYLSNIAPQNPSLNRGAWAKLEEEVRKWVLERMDLIVITGPVFGVGSTVIGASPVRVPVAFYKVIFDPFRREAIGFVYPNVPPASSNIADYQVPVEQIELTTGMAFVSVRP